MKIRTTAICTRWSDIYWIDEEHDYPEDAAINLILYGIAEPLEHIPLDKLARARQGIIDRINLESLLGRVGLGYDPDLPENHEIRDRQETLTLLLRHAATSAGLTIADPSDFDLGTAVVSYLVCECSFESVHEARAVTIERAIELLKPGADGEKIPERARNAIEQYNEACKAVGVDELEDRKAHKMLVAIYEKMDEKSNLPSFDTWSRNLRTARECTGTQKHVRHLPG